MVTLLLFVVKGAPKVKTLPVRERAPLVVRAPLKAVVPEPLDCVRVEPVVTAALAVAFLTFVIRIAPRTEDPPTTSPKFKEPRVPRFKLKAPGPSKVLEKVMFCPLADVSREVGFEREVGLAKEIAPPAVIDPAKETEELTPPLVCVHAPAIE